MEYRVLVVVDKAGGNYSAYSPDVPGCVSVGDTVAETVKNMREALEFHLGSMVRDGDSMPESCSAHAEFVEIRVPDPVAAATQA